MFKNNAVTIPTGFVNPNITPIQHPTRYQSLGGGFVNASTPLNAQATLSAEAAALSVEEAAAIEAAVAALVASAVQSQSDAAAAAAAAAISASSAAASQLSAQNFEQASLQFSLNANSAIAVVEFQANFAQLTYANTVIIAANAASIYSNATAVYALIQNAVATTANNSSVALTSSNNSNASANTSTAQAAIATQKASDAANSVANALASATGATASQTSASISANAAANSYTLTSTALGYVLSNVALANTAAVTAHANALIAAANATSAVLANTSAWAAAANAALTHNSVIAALGFTPLQVNQTITVTGDATGSGSNAITLTLGNSGVTAASYNNLTIDAKGRVTGARALSNTDVTGALGFTPYNATNPSSYLTGITSTQVTTALTYTPANLAGASFTGAVSSTVSLSAPTVTATSDMTLKDREDDIPDDVCFSFLSQLVGFTYTFKASGATMMGLSAQEVQVLEKQYGLEGRLVFTDTNGKLSLAYGQMMAMVGGAFRYQAALVDRLAARLDILERKAA